MRFSSNKFLKKSLIGFMRSDYLECVGSSGVNAVPGEIVAIF